MGEETTWTGERLETFVYNDNTIEHLHRYAFALDYVKNKIVLDIASGEGYGSNLLAKYATKVYGVDIDINTINLAKEKYDAKNLEFIMGSTDKIPLPDNCVDIVVSFETLEHHDKHNEMMEEIQRVMKPEGILIISTPEKKYYSDNKNYKNPFHIKELYLDEFKLLMSGYFNHTQFYFQNMFRGSLMVPELRATEFRSYNGSYENCYKEKGYSPMYIVCIASNKLLDMQIDISGFHGDNIEEKKLEEIIFKVRQETMIWLKKSWSYRIGNAILAPLKFFKK